MKRGLVFVFTFLLVAFPSSGASENDGSISHYQERQPIFQSWDKQIVIQPNPSPIRCNGALVSADGAAVYSVEVNGNPILSKVSGKRDITAVVHDLVEYSAEGTASAMITIKVEGVEDVELLDECRTEDDAQLETQVSRLVVFCDGDCDKLRTKKLGC